MVATTVMAIIVDKIIMFGPTNTKLQIGAGTYIKKAHTKSNFST
jgi:hypothetical protein